MYVGEGQRIYSFQGARNFSNTGTQEMGKIWK